MEKIYSEADATWSSIERDVPYIKVIWSMGNNGIPKYQFIED